MLDTTLMCKHYVVKLDLLLHCNSSWPGMPHPVFSLVSTTSRIDVEMKTKALWQPLKQLGSFPHQDLKVLCSDIIMGVCLYD